MARSPSVAGLSCTRQLAQKRVHARGVRAIRSDRRLQLQKDATRTAGVHAHSKRANLVLVFACRSSRKTRHSSAEIRGYKLKDERIRQDPCSRSQSHSSLPPRHTIPAPMGAS